MTRVLVADDEADVRWRVKELINAEEGMEVVAEAEDGDAVLTLVRDKQVDVIVLDMGMPGLMAYEVIEALQEEHPDVQVIILSVHPASQYEEAMELAGASRYIMKGADAEMKVVEAIRQNGT